MLETLWNSFDLLLTLIFVAPFTDFSKELAMSNQRMVTPMRQLGWNRRKLGFPAGETPTDKPLSERQV
jgi:hypothetical protein